MRTKKVHNLKGLLKIINTLKAQKKKIVFANGCFDILHPGHLSLLRQAKKKGDVLVVGMNSDSSVRKIKGLRRPIFNQRFRSQILEAIEFVDYILIFNGKTPYREIVKLRPDIIVKGGDWAKNEIVGADIVKKVIRIKLKPGYSTTGIIKKIKSRA
ncbi:MAG: adenylyltransferase/cytidyltransferase family protein [Candidatus Omnitrophica bacterium]|nr:adenylyltransferase/cytidyltransferase family protein [Candidatus Omnitrophota bacterium]MDD5429715.1 adenylyltransferase/cytidyltransferase family protein [Candidatus Omnitrophota bacterium]